jgi:1-acyl-sn-glycerol-3-phosphate acyltransferase
MRYKCIGKEYLDTNSAQIVIFNHYSLLDMFAINRHFVIAAKPLIKKELLSIPILGWLFRMTAIPIDRNSSASKQAGFIKMKEELDKGISILIFPEGTRNRTTKPLNPFKDGAFRLAIETNTAIQPAVILNTRKLAKPNSLIFKPGTIIVQYLPPIFPKDFDNNLELFIEHCYKKMEEAILKFESSIGTKTKE